MSKRVYTRDTETALVGGVVAGLADYLEQDPVLFRIVAIGLLIVTGLFPGLLLYGVAWVFTPTKKQQSRKADYEISE
jgi:phage shock protein C